MQPDPDAGIYHTLAEYQVAHISQGKPGIGIFLESGDVMITAAR